MRKRGQEVVDGQRERVRRAILIADRELIVRTPKDTVHCAPNWIASVGAPVLEVLDVRGHEALMSALLQGASVAGQWDYDQGSAYISNSVHYVVPLENGHSAQAPQGMTRFAIAAAENEIGNIKVLKV